MMETPTNPLQDLVQELVDIATEHGKTSCALFVTHTESQLAISESMDEIVLIVPAVIFAQEPNIWSSIQQAVTTTLGEAGQEPGQGFAEK
ncbi:MAG TPA: hypothetical protein EYP85_13200 [Armatimonadetes bacterium]|nr:hypothetical protein [Armatimonadota bacterium]